MNLSNKQKQFLKAKAHELKPIILLGGNGLTEGVMAEIDLALEHHELIKVKVGQEHHREIGGVRRHDVFLADGLGLDLHRPLQLRALHAQAGTWIRSPKRPLGRLRQDRVRHPPLRAPRHPDTPAT